MSSFPPRSRKHFFRRKRVVRTLRIEPLETRFAPASGGLLHTFSNPTPADNDQFSSSLSVSGDYVLVGAQYDDTGSFNAGSAYLFEAGTGNLLRTFNNPTPDYYDNFGCSVSVSGNYVLVGARYDDTGATDTGSAYLFNASTGNLLRTFNNPTPVADDQFGSAISVSGNYVLVGALGDDTGATNAGTSYLFDASTGSLLRTISNPTPATSDLFGYSVSVSGNYALVGARSESTGASESGSAYLFEASTGNLLQTFNNPTPSDYDYFGESVSVSGNCVLVGASSDDTGATNAGSAYLFDALTGSLLRTFNNPALASGGNFGYSVSVSGTNVLVGAGGDDTGATNAGSAYLFDATTGSLLRTFKKPTPTAEDYFGNSVSVSGNVVLVGAVDDDAGANNAGSAYLFDISLDYGDAPDSYGTLSASNGARHIIGGPHLGAAVDTEVDGQPTTDASGDDTAGGDDEDGVTFTSSVFVSASTSISADVNVNATGGKLDAWIDFNRDGDFNDAGEQIFANQPLANGDNDLTFSVPASVSPGDTYVRVRVSTDGGLSPMGLAGDGEVEDYEVSLMAVPAVSLTGGTLTITGTGDADHVRIDRDPGDTSLIRVNDLAHSLSLGAFADTLVSSISASLGDGNDTLVIDDSNGSFTTTRPTTIVGGDGNDSLIGGAGGESLSGGEGSDSLGGSDGNDSLNGGEGNDDLSGAAGNDLLAGDAHSDTLDGGAGNDCMLGGSGDDSLAGAAGNDMLAGGLGNDSLSGGVDEDIVSYIDAPAGVTVDMGAGTASGGDGNDSLLPGFEALYGSDYADSLKGDGEDNWIRGNGGNDSLDGAGGSDVADYETAPSAVTVDLNAHTASGGDGNDVLVNMEGIAGSSFNDVLTGDAGDNFLWGNTGNDALNGGAGEQDFASYWRSAGSVTVDLNAGTSSGSDGNDSLTNIENIEGSSFNDSLVGDAGNNMFLGNLGNDSLDGGGGEDYAAYGGASTGVVV